MDLLKIFFGIIVLRVLFWFVKGYAKQPEKLQFIAFATKKYPFLLMGPLITLAMIGMAIYQDWSFDSVIILVVAGLFISIFEDIFVMLGVDEFRTKNFKIDDKEVSSETSDKGNIWLGILISTTISGAILYFISREVEWNMDSLFSEYWLILVYLVLLSLISALKVLRVNAVNDEPYDASMIFSKLILRPFGFVFLLMMVSSLDLFPAIISVCLFLLLYGIIGFFGQCFSLVMTLPKKEQEELVEKFKQTHK